MVANLEELVERSSQVVHEDENLCHGFAMLPYPVLKDSGLSSSAKVLYALLLSYSWQADRCFPGQDTLADEMGCDRTTISRVMRELTDGRLVSVERRGLGKSNVYHILKLTRRYKMLVDRAANG